MAIYCAFVKPSAAFGEILPLLPPRTLAVRPEFACLKKFVVFTHSEAYKSFRRGQSAASKFEVEWLCRLACTRNHSKAIAFCRPRGPIVALLSPKKIPKEAVARIGVPADYSLSGDALAAFAAEYGFGSAALEKYRLEDLLVEKCVVEFLQ